MDFKFFRLSGKISFRIVGIAYNPNVETALMYAQKIQAIFSEKKIKSEILTTKELSNKFSSLIVIGGDGSILKAARFCTQYGIPFFGFNVGRLGFLAQANAMEIESVVIKLLNNEFKVDRRMLLTAKNLLALNEMVIKGANIARTSDFLVEIDGKKVCEYRADGLIIATPTGSTAYNLSANGPILYPNLDNIIITPICPHTLNARPLVIPANQKISVSALDKDEKLSITADGQESTIIESTEKVCIEKYSKQARLLLLDKEDSGFYSVLREKLNWGVVPKS